MKNEGSIERYKLFCKAFDLNVGDIIKIPGWFSYIVGEDYFSYYEDGKIRKPHYQPYSQLMERGFIKINQYF